jgi:hypothetical protein
MVTRIILWYLNGGKFKKIRKMKILVPPDELIVPQSSSGASTC